MVAPPPCWSLHPDWPPAVGWAERKRWPECWLVESWRFECSSERSWWSEPKLLHSSELQQNIEQVNILNTDFKLFLAFLL